MRHGVKKLIYISSTGAIPELPAGQKITEVNHFWPRNGLIGYYSETKAEATQLVLDALEKYPELDACVIHPSGICGPYDYAFGPVSSMVRDFVQGKMKMSRLLMRSTMRASVLVHSSSMRRSIRIMPVTSSPCMVEV